MEDLHVICYYSHAQWAAHRRLSAASLVQGLAPPDFILSTAALWLASVVTSCSQKRHLAFVCWWRRLGCRPGFSPGVVFLPSYWSLAFTYSSSGTNKYTSKFTSLPLFLWIHVPIVVLDPAPSWRFDPAPDSEGILDSWLEEMAKKIPVVANVLVFMSRPAILSSIQCFPLLSGIMRFK